MTRTNAVLFSGLLSIAATAAESAPSHFYAGVAVGQSSVDGAAEVPARVQVSPIFMLPPDIPIAGMPFDDEQTAWSAFVGYDTAQYLGVELGFWNHGTFDSALLPLQPVPRLRIREWYLGATFNYPLLERLTATASAGVSRAQFKALGSLRVLVLAPTPFPVLPPIGLVPASLPVASPEDETGGHWRIGLNWRFTNSWEAGLSYGRRDLQVLQVKSLALNVQHAF
jgi:hypothetical protein